MCPKHKSYKGLRKPKRDCPICLSFYEQNQQVVKENVSFYSITTPGFKCGLHHVLAELCCLMLYGALPKYFWRSGSAHEEARESYKKIYRDIQFFYSKDTSGFDSLYSLIHNVYDSKCKKLYLKRAQTPTEIIDEQDVEINTQDIVDLSTLNVRDKTSKWQKMKELGNGNKR